MNNAIRNLQALMGVSADGSFGPVTARALADACQRGSLTWDHSAVVAARAEVRAAVPDEHAVLARVNPLLEDDPNRPGYGRWKDGGAWFSTRTVRVDVPLLGGCTIDRAVAGYLIAAWAEVAQCTTYRPGAVSCVCIRRMNRNVHQSWSLHCTGYCLDVDLDRDSKWERREQISPECAKALAILESWGWVLGAHWQGKSEDDMHAQWARV